MVDSLKDLSQNDVFETIFGLTDVIKQEIAHLTGTYEPEAELLYASSTAHDLKKC